MAVMSGYWGRCLAVTVAAVGAFAVVGPAAAQAHAGGVVEQGVVSAVSGRQLGSLDGFVIGYLPDGVGTPSDFQYEWGDVTFHTRDWESRTDSGWQVDLTVQTLRGDRLDDLDAVRDFLVDYLEKDPDGWRLEPFRNGHYRGYLADDQAFWFVRPGVAASVRIDRERYDRTELTATARGFQPA